MNRRLLLALGLFTCMSIPVIAWARAHEYRHEESANKHEMAQQDQEGRHPARPTKPGETPRERRDDAHSPSNPPQANAAPESNPGVGRSDRHAEHFRTQQATDRRRRVLAMKDAKAWNDARPGRAQARRSDIVQTWGNVANSPQAKVELSTHADRMARLNRILDLAEQKGDTAMIARTNDMISKEIARNASVMSDLQTKGGAQ